MKVIEEISRSAMGHRQHENEDIVGHVLHGAWVIDGVSNIYKLDLKSKQSNQTRWLVLKLNETLKKHLDSFGNSIIEIIKSGVIEAKREFREITYSNHSDQGSVPEYVWPSVSIVVVREIGNSLEWYVIGDCIAYVETSAQSVVIEHHQSRRIQLALKEELERELANRGKLRFSQIRKEIIEPMLRRNKKENPQFIPKSLHLDTNSVDQGLTGTIQINDETQSILMSDGYARAVDDFLLYKEYHDLLKDSLESGSESVLRKIREVERSDYECVRYPRLKKSDDASAILIKHKPAGGLLTNSEIERLRYYAGKLEQAESFTLDEARDMQKLVERARNNSENTESLFLAGLLGVLAGVAIGVLGKIAYDFIIGSMRQKSSNGEQNKGNE